MTRGREPQRRRRSISTTASPIQAQAQANFAANPPAGVPISAVGLRRAVGGYTYLSDDQQSAWTADKNNFQPRAGFTYKLNEPMVLRGGIGLFIAPFQVRACRASQPDQPVRLLAQHAVSGHAATTA